MPVYILGPPLLMVVLAIAGRGSATAVAASGFPAPARATSAPTSVISSSSASPYHTVQAFPTDQTFPAVCWNWGIGRGRGACWGSNAPMRPWGRARYMMVGRPLWLPWLGWVSSRGSLWGLEGDGLRQGHSRPCPCQCRCIARMGASGHLMRGLLVGVMAHPCWGVLRGGIPIRWPQRPRTRWVLPWPSDWRGLPLGWPPLLLGVGLSWLTCSGIM